AKARRPRPARPRAHTSREDECSGHLLRRDRLPPRPVRRPDLTPLRAGHCHTTSMLEPIKATAQPGQHQSGRPLELGEQPTRGTPELHGLLEASLAQEVVHPGHSGQIVREFERVEPLAKRAECPEIWAAVDRVDDSPEAATLPRLPRVACTAHWAGR